MSPHIHILTAREFHDLGPLGRATLARHRRRTVAEYAMAHQARFHGAENARVLRAALRG